MISIDYNNNNVTLTKADTSVTCEDVTYVDYKTQEELEGVYEEWTLLAEGGEDGYYIEYDADLVLFDEY